MASIIDDVLADSDSGTDIDSNSSSDTDIYDLSESEDELSNSITIDNWQEGNYEPRELQFSANPGINCELSLDGDSALQYFEQIIDADFIDHIVDQTNLYYYQSPYVAYENAAPWYNIDASEMYSFIAVLIIMGIVRKTSIKDYWSTNELISTPFIPKIFTRDRFLMIYRYLHFNDNETVTEGRMRKIAPIIKMLKSKFSSTIIPSQNLCIDESLILFKGRLAFKQFIPSKRSRFGVKLFVLVDCNTKFILDFIFYLGAETPFLIESDLGFSGSVVKSLMQPYIGCGRVLYVDNWYSSPLLFQYLFNNNTGACGTIRKNRKHFPVFHQRLLRGESVHLHTRSLLALKWHDKREVHMLSTIHTPEQIATGKIDHKTGREILKPRCIIDYNNNMGGVDQVDMQMSFSELARKTKKWYKKVALHLIDLAIFNAYRLYKIRNPAHLSLSDFKLKLAEEILERFGLMRTTSVGRPRKNNVQRSGSNHILNKVSGVRRRCAVCINPKRTTTWECLTCNVGLCKDKCFENYHKFPKL